MSDLEEDNLIKYKNKKKKKKYLQKKEKEDILNNLQEKDDEEDKSNGIQKSREFAIIDAKNQVHIIKAETFEHFSLEYVPVE